VEQLANERDFVLEVDGQLTKEQALSLVEHKVTKLLGDPAHLQVEVRKKFTIIGPSPESDITLTDSIKEIQRVAATGGQSAYSLEIRSRSEEEEALLAAQSGASIIIAKTPDWKIIPLENLIAKLQGTGCKLYARIDSPKDASSFLGVLEKGVDGLVLRSNSEKDLDEILSHLDSEQRLDLKPLRISEILDVGLGERVCVDSTSILRPGEGALVGNQASFLFLIHNESLASHFTAPRPFRVNAGAIHSYVFAEKGKTNYLSELQSGSKLTVAMPDGQSRVVTVGRAKIERRPLVLVRGEFDGVSGGVIVQKAETIRFVKPDGNTVSVTELSPGDTVLGILGNVRGRHFGMEVDEFVLEK
jgi:3-dehydroquinate synthase II